MRMLHLAAIGSVVLAACAASAPTLQGPSAPPASPPAASSSANEAAASPPAEAPASDAGVEASATAVSEPDAAAGAPAPQSACNEQPPQDFLVRGNFRKKPGGNERAIQYRTDTYGYFKGFGHASSGTAAEARAPSSYVVDTTFMGLPVKMHRKVVPALACAEDEIKQSCSASTYKPHALAGIRFRNTYRGGEVTNHIYGIAIDIDPMENPCCGCVKPWSEAAICKRPAKTEYDRMALPECWVHAFEKYGFYWLGHDVLRDTMHFEFLGDPDRIVR